MAIERAALPVTILPDPNAVGDSLYATLEGLGNTPRRALQKISAVNVERDDARLLKILENAPGLKIERISYLANGRPVEFTRSLFRGDAYEFVADLTPGGD